MTLPKSQGDCHSQTKEQMWEGQYRWGNTALGKSDAGSEALQQEKEVSSPELEGFKQRSVN